MPQKQAPSKQSAVVPSGVHQNYKQLSSEEFAQQVELPRIEVRGPSGVSTRCASIALTPVEISFGIPHPPAWDSVRSFDNAPTPHPLRSARPKSLNSMPEPRRNMTPKNKAIWYFLRLPGNHKATAKLVCVHLDSSEEETVNHYGVKNGQRIPWLMAYQKSKVDRKDIDKRVSAIKTRLKKASDRLHTS